MSWVWLRCRRVSVGAALVFVGILGLGSVDAHNLDQRDTYIAFDEASLAVMRARLDANNADADPGNDVPLIQKDDVIGVILKSTPGPGTDTGFGGYLTFYIPQGTQVVGAAYVQPDGAGGFNAAPLKGPAIAPIGSGPVGATNTPTLAGLLLGPNVLGVTAESVSGSGNPNGTIAGVYGDTGIFYSMDPDTAWQSWVAAGGYDGNTGTNDNSLTNNSGETIVPVNKWDAEQLIAFGLKNPASPLIDPNGRGNAPWGLANAVAGPQSAYAWEFDWETWKSNGNDFHAAVEVGPWQRIRYPGSQAALDTPGLDSSELGFVGVDASTFGHLLSGANPLPPTLDWTDGTSPTAVRFSYGGLELGRSEYGRVELKILEAPGEPGSPFDVNGCFRVNTDALGGDAGGENGGKDHLWRYYDPTVRSINSCALIQKVASKPIVAKDEVFSYQIDAINLGVGALTNVKVTDALPAGLEFVSAIPAPDSTGPLVWNIDKMDPADPVNFPILRTITVYVRATGSGEVFNTAALSSREAFASAEESVRIGSFPLLQPDKTVVPDTVPPGATVTYDLVLNNVGSGLSAEPITITENLPAGFSYVSMVATEINGGALPAGDLSVDASDPGRPVFEIGQGIAAGGSLLLRFDVLVSPSQAAGVYGNSFAYEHGGNVVSSGSLAPVTVGGAKIGDTVFRDWDGDGSMDVEDEGIPNVTVQLYAADGIALLDTTTTDADGNYFFTGLTDATYVVRVLAPSGYTQTFDADGLGTADESTVTLAFDEENFDQDFGYLPGGSGSIGDLVFEDVGNDGVFDGADTGIDGVTVNLYEDSDGDGSIGAGDYLVATTVTAGGGLYAFTGLAEGLDYIVDVAEGDAALGSHFSPEAYAITTADPHAISSLSGSYQDADFGFFELTPASIGDEVFLDNDGDGSFSAGDLRLANVGLSLYRDGNSDGEPDFAELVASTQTGSSGMYGFGGLGPGEYIVVVDAADADIPAGYVPAIGSFRATLNVGDDRIDADFPLVRLISKAVDKATANPGDTLTYSINVNYTGEELLADAVVEDTIPAGTSLLSVGQGGSDNGTSVSWALGSNTAAIPSSGGGGISVDNSSTNKVENANSVTVSHATGAGPNRYMVVAAASRDGEAVTGVTYGGQALTPLVDLSDSSHAELTLYYMDAPPVGTADVVVSLDGNSDHKVVGVTTFFGVASATVVSDEGGNGDLPAGLRSFDVTTVAGDLVYDVFDIERDPSVTPDGSQNLEYQDFAPTDVTSSGSQMSASSKLATSTTTNMSWTVSDPDHWAHAAVVLSPAGSSASRTNAIAASPTLLSSGGSVQVQMTLTADALVSGAVPEAPVVTGTNGASATLVSGPTPASSDVDDGSPAVFTWTYSVNAGSVPGSVTFSAGASGDAGSTVYDSATSNSVLVAPPLTFQVEVNSPAEVAVVDNSATVSANGANVPTGRCYVVADWSGSDADRLLVAEGGAVTDVGLTGTTGVEAAIWNADGSVLYAVDGNQLGSFDLTTGVFTAVVPANFIGAIDGAFGSIATVDVDGLSFDPNSGDLWALHRREAGVTDLDVIFRIDAATGMAVADTFGAGVDYLAVQTGSLSTPLYDVDDISFHPTTGVLYGIASNDAEGYGASDRLVTIDTATGAVTDVGRITDSVTGIPISDMEGLSFMPDGTLMGTTGDRAGAAPAAPSTLDNITTHIGHSYRFTVTGSTSGDVYGTDFYTTDSELAAAAVHAGVLADSVTGVVDIVRVPDQASFTASTRNGVTSLVWGAPDPSYQFVDPANDNSSWMIDPATAVATQGSSGFAAHGASDLEAIACRPDQPGVQLIPPTPSNEVTTALSGGIGDFVWIDLDSDGVYDPGDGELPLGGVEVCASNGVVTYCATTDGSGMYQIFGLDSNGGSPWTVTLNLATVPVGYLPTTATSLDRTLATDTTYDDTADFGVAPPPTNPGSIGDMVWIDADEDGAVDVGELPLPGVTVWLYADNDNDGSIDVSAGDSLVRTTTTDAGGAYLFASLPAGDYLVQVDPASQVTSPDGATHDLGAAMELVSGTAPHDVALTAGQNYAVADFGYNWAGSIAGIAYYDDDANLVRDLPGETKVAGVTVVLYRDENGNGKYDGGETPVGFTQTDGAGDYIFENLPPGDYVVKFDESTVESRSMPGVFGRMVSTTGSNVGVVLGAGVDHTGADAGFIEAAEIEGHVFHDLNGDGFLGGGEPRLPGVEVTLSGTDILGDPVLLTFDSDADGEYKFLVAPGVYTVSYAPGDGAIPAVLSQLTTTSSYNVTANAGDEIGELDFGRDNSGAVGDTLFADADGDGSMGAAEPGLEGVTVMLFAADGTTLLASAVTDADGGYLFGGLADGDYVVEVDTSTLPAGYSSAPSADPDAVPDSRGSATVSLGAADLGMDFGYQPVPPTHTLSGTVFNDDSDGDGILDGGEPGLGGVRVTAEIDADGNGDAEQAFATVTAADGTYSFTGIPDGADVTLKVSTATLPGDAFAPTGDRDSPAPGGDNEISLSNITSGATELDFGYEEVFGSIAGTVVVGDGDGLAEGGEPALEAVTVTLTFAGADGVIGTADDSQQATATDASGDYAFTGLAPGVYAIVETDPAGYASLADADGGNPDNISASLAFGEVLADQDFEDGLGAAISGRVVLDVDVDGDLGEASGEPGIAGVTVTLWTDPDGDGDPSDGFATATTSSAGDGSYSFADVVAGDYVVVETDPADHGSTGDRDGTGSNSANEIAVVLAGVDSTGNDFLDSPYKVDSFADWQTEQAGELAGQDEPDDNPDGDIYDNALEYALCLPPGSGYNPKPFCVKLFSGSGTVDAIFFRRRGSLSDVTYTLETATVLGDPTVWTDWAGAAPTVDTTSAGIPVVAEKVTFSDLPTTVGPVGFVRLRVEIARDSTSPHHTQVFGWHTVTNTASCETCSFPYAPKEAFSSTPSAVSGDRLTLTVVGTPLLGSGDYYIEILSGTFAGHRFDVASVAADTVVLGGASARDTLSPVPDLSGAPFALRPHNTLDSIAPPALFAANNDPSAGDRILAFDGAGWTTYWIYDLGGTQPKQWTDVADGGLSDAGGTVVDAPEAFFLHPKAGDVDLVMVGVVREWPFACPLLTGYNLIGSGYPFAQSPAGREMLRDDSVQGDTIVGKNWFDGSNDPLAADQLMFWNGDAAPGTTGYHTYFRLYLGAGLDHWTDQTDSALADSDADLIFGRSRGAFVDMMAGHDRSDAADVWVWPLPWSADAP